MPAADNSDATGTNQHPLTLKSWQQDLGTQSPQLEIVCLLMLPYLQVVHSRATTKLGLLCSIIIKHWPEASVTLIETSEV